MVNLNKNQKNILSLYGLFGAGAIMMMIPYGVIPFAGFACALVVFLQPIFTDGVTSPIMNMCFT